MNFARYALGVLALVWVFVTLASSAVTLRSYFLPQLEKAPARLADAVVGLALLVALLELLGAAGMFNLAAIVIACAAVAVCTRAWLSPAVRRRSTGPSRKVRRSLFDVVSIGAGLLVAGVLLAQWTGPTVQSLSRCSRSAQL
jgi:hypothetical protein